MGVLLLAVSLAMILYGLLRIPLASGEGLVAKDGTFLISVFSVLHFGGDEHSFGPAADKNSAALMRHVFDLEKPDFVVLTGDFINGENTFAFNSTDYVDQIVEPLVEDDYLWASTYGNHDSKYNLSRDALFAEENKHKGEKVKKEILWLYCGFLTLKEGQNSSMLRQTKITSQIVFRMVLWSGIALSNMKCR